MTTAARISVEAPPTVPGAARASEHLAPGRPVQGARRRLVYILAASHSGSTLLTMLLGAHPEICTVGELKAAIPDDVRHYRCSCGALIQQCAFWMQVAAGMARRGLDFDIGHAGTDLHSIDSAYVRRLLRPLHRPAAGEWLRDAALWLSPTWRRGLPVFQRRNVALVDTLCELAGCNVVVDSSKYALRLKYLLRNPALDVQVIRLIRDGRGVALTYYLDEQRLGMAAAAREWRRSNEEAEALLRGVPRSRWTAARYEELCASPLAVVRRLCAFIGVDPQRATLAFRDGAHHVVGNWMRTQTTADIRLDERWRTMLTAVDLRAFEAVSGPLNRRYGYE